ncbi:MAG: Tad domain-containing protein [Candidatus Brocadiae bacterium]|nr:Tad domain-containing protein [Candidatus Brocadiia bacterium]
MNAVKSVAKRRGQVIILAPVLLLVLACILAMAVDVGHMCVARARLQNAADSGALAAMQVLEAKRRDGRSEEDGRAAACEEARAFAELNTSGVGFTVEFGYVDEGGAFVVLADDDHTPASAARTRVTRDADAPDGELALFFAPLLGIRSVEVAVNAVAEASSNVRGFISGLRPLAVWEGDIVPIGRSMIFYEHELIAPGNFGLLDFDGGSNPTGDLEDWILNGYDGKIELDPETGYLWIEGNPGFRAALKDELQAIEGDSINILVYDDVTSSGSNAEFRCIGFLGLTLVGSKLTGNDKYIEARVTGFTSVHGVLMDGGWSSPNLGKAWLAQ